MARLANGTVTFYNLDGDEIEKKPTQIKWDAEAAEKAGYEHFMLKEIHEQPKAVQDTLNSVLKDGAIDLLSVGLTEKELQCLPEQIQKILDDKERIQWFAAKQANWAIPEESWYVSLEQSRLCVLWWKRRAK